MSAWNILYRGSLASCNYTCGYCPFAKTSSTRAELRQDERELELFVDWVGAQKRPIGILFTPWGEALIHPHYRWAMLALAGLPHVYRVAIQTNLSAPLEEFAGADRGGLAFWTTYHPGQTSLARFLDRCRDLDAAALRYSVGVVGLREHFDAIADLRRALSPRVYLWVNAFKRLPGYYQPHEIEWLSTVDPYFHWNLHHFASGGEPCLAGETTFAVDGIGNVRRCHFIPEVIGNIYTGDIAECLLPRNCSNSTCGCHIGYVHRPKLRLNELYGAGLLERIPLRWPEVLTDFSRKD